MPRRGTIVSVNLAKHFGFLSVEGEARERFFHGSDCDQPLRDFEQGALVTFDDDDPGAKGPRAKNVRLYALDDGEAATNAGAQQDAGLSWTR